jgi:hypothetical protein
VVGITRGRREKRRGGREKFEEVMPTTALESTLMMLLVYSRKDNSS